LGGSRPAAHGAQPNYPGGRSTVWRSGTPLPASRASLTAMATLMRSVQLQSAGAEIDLILNPQSKVIPMRSADQTLTAAS